MPQNQVDNNLPEIPLTLELDPSLGWVTSPDDPLNVAVRSTIERGLAAILATLGIPGWPVLQIRAAGAQSPPAHRFMRLFVVGQCCRCSDELLQRVYCYVNGIQLDPEVRPAAILAWLRQRSGEGTETAEREQLVSFLGMACCEIIKCQPADLLAREQIIAYIAGLPGPADGAQAAGAAWSPDAAWLLPILQQVIALNISIADRPTVAQVLQAGGERSQDVIAEDLIAALRPDVIEIHVAPAYLQQLTTDNMAQGPELAPFLRDGLFTELGLTYPSFRFMPRANLKPNSFAFTLNHLTTIPLFGLQPDQCLVNDTAPRLSSVNAAPTVNPATGQPASIVGLRLKPQLEESKLTTWDQMGYLILCFADVLRRNSQYFLDRRTVRDLLDQLQPALPVLVQVTQAKLPIELMTRVLRALVAEELSIRNLPSILERLLDYELNKADLAPQRDTLAFVRTGLRQAISNKYARGTETIVVYLLDPPIEQLLLTHTGEEGNDWAPIRLEESRHDAITDAVRAEIAYLPETVRWPVILTSAEVRPVLWRVIAAEFPRMSVIAYGEIPPGKNIQPVARISVS